MITNKNGTDEAGNVIVEKRKSKKENAYILFYALAVLLVIYMGYAAYTSYEAFVDYCTNYNLNVSDQIGMMMQSVLATTIPCLSYAATMYGIGYIIKNQKR